MAGKVPGLFQTPTGRWMVEVDEEEPKKGAALYARVSSNNQKQDLDRQVARLARYAAENGFVVTKVISEVGSGLNGKRKGLIELMSDRSVETIIVEHRDRLARFGVTYIEAALAATERKIVIVEQGEVQEDLVQDMIDLMTCFSARLYDRRSAKNRAKRALKELGHHEAPTS
jgi:putative resolvase